MKRRCICTVIIALLCCALIAPAAAERSSAAASSSVWQKLKTHYAVNPKVKQLIFVQYQGNSKAKLILYKKTKEKKWKKVLSCRAYVGKNGIGKVREGDMRTPTGTYMLNKAFGCLKDPGSKMKYTRLNKNLYWCGDRHYYNKMIDIRKAPHRCKGEHLYLYKKQYAYAMNINYNRKGEYGKGSAIFLHCYGYNPYTAGCVAVSKKNMKKILRTCGSGTVISIYWK